MDADIARDLGDDARMHAIVVAHLLRDDDVELSKFMHALIVELAGVIDTQAPSQLRRVHQSVIRATSLEARNAAFRGMNMSAFRAHLGATLNAAWDEQQKLQRTAVPKDK